MFKLSKHKNLLNYKNYKNYKNNKTAPAWLLDDLQPPQHQVGNEKAESTQGVGNLRSERPVEERTKYRPCRPAQGSQGAEHAGHDSLLVVLAVLRDQAGQAGNHEGGGDGVEAEAGVELGDGLTVPDNDETRHDQQQSSHGGRLLLPERDPPDDAALQSRHDDPDEEEHPALNITVVSPASLTRTRLSSPAP